METFHKFKAAELLGVTPISRVSDSQIWSQLVTPQLKSFLGPIVSSTNGVSDSTEGLFPGDHVTNINDHLLYGGKRGFVRFPYIWSLYKTAYGCFVVKRDGLKFKAFGWYGNYEKGSAQMIFNVGLRDRRFDGTLRANDCSLVDFPYDDPVLNGQIVIPGKPEDATSLETSLYSYIPGSSIATACGDKELDEFVRAPYSFLDRPEVFFKLFERVWTGERYPGQNANPFPDVGKNSQRIWDKIAAQLGYDYLDTAPSHYHVLRWNESFGYRIAFPEHQAIVDQMAAGIRKVKDVHGIKLNRVQEAWICVLQSLRPIEMIPEQFRFGCPVWPQDNISPASLWLYKPISKRALKAQEDSKRAG